MQCLFDPGYGDLWGWDPGISPILIREDLNLIVRKYSEVISLRDIFKRRIYFDFLIQNFGSTQKWVSVINGDIKCCQVIQNLSAPPPALAIVSSLLMPPLNLSNIGALLWWETTREVLALLTWVRLSMQLSGWWTVLNLNTNPILVVVKCYCSSVSVRVSPSSAAITSRDKSH